MDKSLSSLKNELRFTAYLRSRARGEDPPRYAEFVITCPECHGRGMFTESGPDWHAFGYCDQCNRLGVVFVPPQEGLEVKV